MPTRAAADEVLQRTGMVALTYYPEIHVDEPTYTVDDDVRWCLEPVSDLTDQQTAQLREAVAQTITDPTVHRVELFRILLELAPADS